MSSNIEVFSVDVFRHLWHRLNFVQSVLPRYKEFKQEINLLFIDTVIHAVWCRNVLFIETLSKVVKHSYGVFSRSQLDFYLFIKKNVGAALPPCGITVFDKVFMSVAFVAEMGFFCHQNDDRMHLYNAPLCWALYFETELQEEFFSEGGWSELELQAKTYSQRKLFSFDHILSIKNYQDDVTHIKLLYETANEFYNLQDVDNYFKEMYLQREREASKYVSCSSCYPLLATLKSRVFAEESLTDKASIVEGYVQLISKMLPDYELSYLYLTKMAKSSLLTMCHSVKTNQAISEPDQINLEILHTDIFKKQATSVLINHIFGDKNNTSNVGTEYSKSEQIFPCIFCSHKVKSKSGCFDIKYLNKPLDLIKSLISDTIGHSGNLESTAEIKDLGEIQRTKIDKYKKETTGRNPVQNIPQLEDSVIKMFHVLGVDPGKEIMKEYIKENLNSKPNSTLPVKQNKKASISKK